MVATQIALTGSLMILELTAARLSCSSEDDPIVATLDEVGSVAEVFRLAFSGVDLFDTVKISKA